MKMPEKPGICLMLMGWWIVPFFILALASFPLHHHVSSYIPFFLAFAVLAASGAALNVLDGRVGFWERMRKWGRFLVIASSYTATIVVILIVTVVLDDFGLIAYFGGDATGSFGMLYIPSIIFYIIGGAMLTAILAGLDMIRRKNRS